MESQLNTIHESIQTLTKKVDSYSEVMEAISEKRQPLCDKCQSRPDIEVKIIDSLYKVSFLLKFKYN